MSTRIMRSVAMKNLKHKTLPVLTFLAVMMLFSTPAFAQMDLVGEWANLFHEDAPERLGGPDIGDYAGMPLNEAARMKADAWNADVLSEPERQCIPHPADYSPRGPAMVQIWKELDPLSRELVALRTHISWQGPERYIWMDGRPHPDEFAAHTWQGFSTGEWLGQVLKVTTTHLKMGWIRRNGIPRSDQAELTEYFHRHGNYLTWTVIINDPIYLTEPMVRSSDFVWAPGQQVLTYPCLIVAELDHEQGWVPHWLPGTNPNLELYSKTYDVIQEAARGGAATMLPEYRKKVVAAQKWPPPAQPAAGGRGGGGGGAAGGRGGGARGGGSGGGGAQPAAPAGPRQ
jgi:uncharacterized membrane protein YgcG